MGLSKNRVWNNEVKNKNLYLRLQYISTAAIKPQQHIVYLNNGHTSPMSLNDGRPRFKNDFSNISNNDSRIINLKTTGTADNDS